MRNHCLLALLFPWRAEEGLSAMGLIYIQEKTEKTIDFKVFCRVHHPSPLGNRDFDTIKRWTKKITCTSQGSIIPKEPGRNSPDERSWKARLRIEKMHLNVMNT